MEGTAVIQDDNADVEEAEITSDRVSIEESLSQDKITYEEYKSYDTFGKSAKLWLYKIKKL